jgi:hypothetical protein
MLKNTLNIDEMETALGFLGCTSPQDLDASFVNAGSRLT